LKIENFGRASPAIQLQILGDLARKT